jgi:hypothetical protein
MNTIIITIWAIVYHIMEAMHDYEVIQTQTHYPSHYQVWANRAWHRFSAAMLFTLYITIAIITKNPFLFFLPAAIRGLVFWPCLNVFLHRPILSTSNHFMERWFAGKYLIIIYLVSAVTLFILSINAD